MDDARKGNQDQSTRDAILAAAEKLFVENGFADTSVSRIAKEAKVTKSLIHHYFGSKDQLWHEVKYSRIREYLEIQRKELAVTEPDVQCLMDAVTRYFNLFRANPQLARLITWHMIESDKDTHEHERELTLLGIEKLRDGQKEGHLRSDVDPRYILISFFCLVVHWFQAKHEYLKWLGIDNEAEKADEDYLQAMLKVFFEGVLPR